MRIIFCGFHFTFYYGSYTQRVGFLCIFFSDYEFVNFVADDFTIIHFFSGFRFVKSRRFNLYAKALSSVKMQGNHRKNTFNRLSSLVLLILPDGFSLNHPAVNQDYSCRVNVVVRLSLACRKF